MGHINFYNFGSEALIYAYRCTQSFAYLLVGAGLKRRHDRYRELLDRLIELFEIVTDRRGRFIDTGAVGRIVARYDIHHQRRISYGARDWPDLVEAGADEQVRKALSAAIGIYKRLGAEVIEINMPHLDYAIAAYYIIATAAAGPPLLPPGTRRVSHGLTVCFKPEFSVLEPIANSSIFALPTITASAASSFSTTVAL